jgi:hypothetical protein
LISVGIRTPTLNESLKNELLDLTRQISLTKASDKQEDVAYMNFLRERAFNIKLEPSTPRFKSAVKIDSIFKVLKGVRASLNNFIEVSFIQRFGATDEKLTQLLQGIKKDAQPLIVDLNFKSFGASISSDLVVNSSYYSKEISDWKKDVFEKYQNDVIYFDYESEEEVAGIQNRYSDQERTLIYSPILELLKSSNSFTLSITDRNYRPTKELKPISKPIKDKIVPRGREADSTEITLERKYVERSIVFGKKSKVKTLINEELESAQFKIQIPEIRYSDEVVYLKKPIEVTLEYEKPVYTIDYEVFDSVISGLNSEEVIRSFSERFAREYNRVIELEDPSFEDTLKIQFFDELVFSRGIKQ